MNATKEKPELRGRMLYMDEEMLERLRQEAFKRRCTMSAIVRQALKRELDTSEGRQADDMGATR